MILMLRKAIQQTNCTGKVDGCCDIYLFIDKN